jgi:hypothetical protein
MKRFSLLFLMLSALPVVALAQSTPPVPPVVAVPDPIVGLIATILASGLAMWKIIDGLKNMFPGLNGTILKILNFAGNFLTIGGGCVIVGHVNEIGGVVGCFVSAVLASLVSAGLYHGAVQANLARAGGAAALTNVKAVAEVTAPPKP